jgi:hypothetical protein
MQFQQNIKYNLVTRRLEVPFLSFQYRKIVYKQRIQKGTSRVKGGTSYVKF